MKKVLLALSFLLLVVVIISISSFFWWQANSKAPSESSGVTGFVITKNESAAAVVADLAAKKLVTSEVATKIYLRATGTDQKLKPGAYTIAQNLSLPDVVKVLTAGPKDLWVTIPEGWRREQVAVRLAATVPGFNSEEFLAKTAGLEGQLFPDTYLIPTEASVDTVLSIFAKNFAKKSGLTPTKDRDTLILASLVEREARKPEERPLVASVLKNRLDIGMALQVDATVQYAVDTANCKPQTANCKYWEPIYDTKFVSSYNTYLKPGLPPGPIASPGEAAIRAALVPAESDYLYYLTGNDGVTYFAKTLSEHNANVKKYLIDN